jgi:1-acyl-sn-glycerol-3-phosphate acyltransferase
MERTWVRRPLTTVGIMSLAVILLVLSPVWIGGGALVDAVARRWRFPLLRLLCFALCWAWLETLGLMGAAFLSLTGRGHDVDASYRLQEWWCRGMVRSLTICMGVIFEVEGAEHVGSGPLVALSRHVSLADAVMSSWIMGSLLRLQPRYVLKKELSLDPCLDIIGHRLPNYFIDRNSPDIASELVGIEQMANDLGENDVAVIFPEGSRSNEAKRARALEGLSVRSPQRFERLRHLQHLSPPKPAGASALLNAVPGAKVITMWHSGFDGMDTFKGIIRNVGAKAVRVHVAITQHDRSTVPSGEAFVAWLDEQWVKMDIAVHARLTSIRQSK